MTEKWGVNTDEYDRGVSNAFDELNEQNKFVMIDNLLGYVIDIILKEAKQEDRLGRQLLYVMLSAKTNNPMHLAINAPSGEGKNWVLDKVSAMFSENDVIKLYGMTDKALFHESGELVIKATDIDFNAFSLKLDDSELDKYNYYQWDYVSNEIDIQLNECLKREEEGSDSYKELQNEAETDKKHLQQFVKKLINLEHKILIFLDTPRMHLLEIMMPLLSHDSYESEYKYVDNYAGIKTYKNLLRGWPCFIFAQAVDYSKHERWPEVQRRFIVTNPTMDSKEKYKEAIHLIFQKASLPDFVYQKLVVSDEQKQTAKEIIAYISKKITEACSNLEPGKNNTFIPFAEAVESGLTKEQTSDMTAAKRFSSFLELLPMINVMKRPSIIIRSAVAEEAHKIPLAIFDDLKEATILMRYSNGVRPYVLQWYYDIFLLCYNEETAPKSKTKKVGKETVETKESRIAVTSRQLIDATKEKRHKSHTSKYLHEQFIYPLMNQGYIDSVESETDLRSKIYFPANEDDKNIVFSTYFENRAYLIEGSKINIRDITTFPDKQYITSKIEGVLKYSSEIGIDAYIEDSDGKEVPIDHLSEFIDRYYPNPENHFEHFTNSTQDHTSDDYFSNSQNGVKLQENNDDNIENAGNEKIDEINTTLGFHI